MNKELNRPTEDQKECLKLFSEAIDLTRTALGGLTVKEEKTFEYAFVRIFSKMVLTMCEIYTLLMNGYPEGAFALCRQLYEALVILDYLAKNKKDNAMIERFFADIRVSQLKISNELDESNEIYKAGFEKIKKQYSEFLDKRGRFSNYWWVEKGCNFSKLTKKTTYPKNAIYTRMSKEIHISAFNSLVYVSHSEKIVIGKAYEGIEFTALCSMVFFCDAIEVFCKGINVELSQAINGVKSCIECAKGILEQKH